MIIMFILRRIETKATDTTLINSTPMTATRQTISITELTPRVTEV